MTKAGEMDNTPKVKLKFKKAIISTAENLVPTDELLSRLVSLHEELSTLEQGHVELSTLDKIRTDLVNKKLLKHRDNGIRAFDACCLSDILRLYAPDAPYTETQLTDIFKLVLAQFEQLGDPDNGYHVQQTYLITRMLEYRSIVLLSDLPSSSKLLEKLFEIFYDDNKAFQPKLYRVIAGILGEVISEFDALSTAILKLIFNKFLSYNPENIPQGLGVASNCGYQVSLILCDAYSSRMSRHLTKYYSEILYQITNEEDAHTYDKKYHANRTIQKLHKLVLRLWETVPDLVSAVIGFVHHELLSEDDMLRRHATALVGKLLATESTLNFVTTHQDSFNAWLSKVADVNAEVRLQWIELIPAILSARDDIAPELNKGLAKTLIDSEYKVRKLSVAVFDELPIKVIWKTISNTTVYECLLPLTREKNREVRELCISTVAHLYSDSLEHATRTAQTSEIWEIIDSIPSVLFDLYYINDSHINEQVDQTIFQSLFPLMVDDRKRVQRLLDVISHLDSKALTSFFAFNKRQMQMAIAVAKFIEFCELHNDDSSSLDSLTMAKLQKTITWLASGFSDQVKATAALEALKEINDKRIFYLLRTCITNDVSFISLKNSMDELLMKLRDPALFRKNGVRSISNIIPKDVSSQVKILLYRSSPLIYNFSNIPVLLDTGNSSGDVEIAWKRKLLDDISEVNPALFKDHIRTLKTIIEDEGYLDTERETLTLSEALKTVYKISKTLKEQIDFEDSVFFLKLKHFVLEGSPVTAKYAIKLLAISPHAQEGLEAIKTSILPLDMKRDKNFTSHVLVLAEIFRLCPHVLDKDSTDIVSFLIKEVLLANQVVGDSKKEVDWIGNQLLNDSKYYPLSCKLFALKLLTNKLKAISSDATNEDLTNVFTEKTVKLFFYLIASGGELISEYNKENYPTPTNYQTRLRCCAGIQVLKLSCIPFFNDFIKPSGIITLINIVEDESIQVRKEFLERLKNYISRESISIKFLPLIFFTAYEPDLDLKTSTKTWINYTFGRDTFRRNTFFERALPRLIHAIAHHPDIVEGMESEGDSYLNVLTTAIDYLVFYFDSIAVQENFSLLYYLAERVKNYKDLTADDEDDVRTEENDEEILNEPCTRMYVIGELAQMILLAIKEKKGWQHSAYPGKLNLPADLFTPFATIEEAQASFRTYLPDRYTERLRMNVKTKVARILHTSQTQRQKVQKRMLDNEYHDLVKKKRKGKNPSPRHYSQKGGNGVDDESSYSPDVRRAAAAPGAIVPKKSLRVRKKVDYKDDDDEDDEDDAEEADVEL